MVRRQHRISRDGSSGKRRRGWLALALLGTLGLVAVCVSCGRWLESDELTLSGTLEMTEHRVGAGSAGRLAALAVDEGDRVTKGQELGSLDHFEQAERDYLRAKELVDQGGEAKQSAEWRRLAMEDQRIVSPVDGVVLVKVHEIGEVVAFGSPVVVVGDPSRLWVRVYVPEHKVNRLQPGQPASLLFDGAAAPVPGHVSYIAPKAEFTPRNVQTPEERMTQTFAVKVSLDRPDDGLHPGVSATVRLQLNPS